jgi:Capsule polysaccharide biosynthesis protein
MRILVVTFAANWPHHFETELEIIQSHLDLADDVVLVGCFGGIPTCYGNPEHRVIDCERCISRRHAGLSTLTSPLPLASLDSYYTSGDAAEEAALDDRFLTIEAAKAFRLGDFDIGFAALSTAISHSRDPELSTPEARTLYRNAVHAAFRVHRCVRNFLSADSSFDRIYVFNGRFEVTRAAFCAAREDNLDVYLHERGSSNARYALYKNRLPHDRSYFIQRLEEAWNAAEDEADRDAVAASFYESRRNAIPVAWTSFVADQVRGEMPASWDDAVRNVVIFNSSEDEFAAIGDEWANPLYSSQYDALVQMIESIRRAPGKVRLYLRVHPNLRGVDNPDMRRTLALSGAELEVIPPESPVSSYALLDRADCVVSFGSTIGIEAVFWGKPSVLAGTSFYRDLHCTYLPTSHDELMELIASDLEPMSKLAALKYGYYLASYGIPFQYYRAESFWSGKFREIRVDPLPDGIHARIAVRLIALTSSWPTACRRLLAAVRMAGLILRPVKALCREPYRRVRRWCKSGDPVASGH